MRLSLTKHTSVSWNKRGFLHIQLRIFGGILWHYSNTHCFQCNILCAQSIGFHLKHKNAPETEKYMQSKQLKTVKHQNNFQPSCPCLLLTGYWRGPRCPALFRAKKIENVPRVNIWFACVFEFLSAKSFLPLTSYTQNSEYCTWNNGTKIPAYES